MTKQIPDVENEVSLASREMTIPSQYKNVDWGARKRLRNRKVSHIERGGDHKIYGSKAIMTKETAQTFSEYLLSEQEDLSLLPDRVVGEIKTNIRKGANDLEQDWKNALELTNKAYQVANVRRPSPNEKGAWKQYEEMIAHAVKSLAQARGIDGKWRTTATLVVNEADQGVGTRRFFVEIPGEQAREVTANSMDEIIEGISNKIRNSRDVVNTKVRVEERTKTYAILGVWVGDVKRERIVIKQL